MPFQAVIFDLGGVVLGSPLHAIAAYEAELGLPENFINRVVADTAPHGGWARLERGELTMAEFHEVFEEDCRRAGGTIDARTMMQRMGEATQPRGAMLSAIERIRSEGLSVAALTNNWATAEPEQTGQSLNALREYFDVFVESSSEGLRKPDPRIYELVCSRLEVAPDQAVFLDDIGSNLKPARAMGITTIRVTTPEDALLQLESVLGFPLDA